MRAYSARNEERVRLQALAREWTRSGLLDRAQQATIDAQLAVDLTRTNTMLRGGLALFTAIVVAASVLLISVLFHITERTAVAVLMAASAIACYLLAEWLVSAFKLYRYGVEEMLAVSAAILLALAAASMMPGRQSEENARAALVVAALGAFGLYRRFGYVYAAVGAMACAAAVPFQLDLAPVWRHLIAAAGLACVGSVARLKRRPHGDDFPGDEYGTLQAAAYVGVYLTLNLKIDAFDIFFAAAQVGRGFYWATYVLTWVLPPVALWLGIRDKDRKLIDVGIATSLATLVTNKPYLGWTRRPWDPILLGVLLIVVAILVRRWLASAPRSERRGFTPLQILVSDREALARLGTVSVALPRPVQPAAAEPPSSEFGGGRSGGGGAGGTF